ncbi:MAG: S8 family serine peptidase [Kibdelosporangium sp.]
MGVGRRRRVALAAGASAALFGAALAVAPTALGAPDGAPIRLISGDFRPTSQQMPRSAPGLDAKAVGDNEVTSYLVQFGGPVRTEWTQALLGVGAQIVEYLPDFAYRVRLTPVQARQAEKASGVSWVGRFQPAWKVDRKAQDKIGSGRAGVYKVKATDAARARVLTERTGAVVSKATDGTLLVAAEPGQATQIAALDEVTWVEEFRIPVKHNESAAGVIMRGAVANTRGYDGSTQTVAVADTGLGGGSRTTAHADIQPDRVTAIHDWPSASAAGCYTAKPDGPQDVDSGHGTHTTVSAVGGGDSNGLGKAAASKAKLVFQAVEDYVDMTGSCALQYPDGYYLLGLPLDLASLFQQAYNDGARIHSNSWGSADAGAYTDDSRLSDAFANTHKDMLITFSVGNEGVDANRDGVIDNDSIGAPATAKNVLSVGASENSRPNWACDPALTYVATGKEGSTVGNRSCQQLGGTQPLPKWGEWWPEDYPAEPLRSDPQAGNDQQMAAFSSRGPTDDGRIKPDVVAPGSWVASGYSDMYQQGYDSQVNPQNGLFQADGYGYPVNSRYKYFSGTSMSNPLVAGGAAVVRDFYNKKFGVNASSALVKATLVNSADDLSDENNDGVNDNDFAIPNVHEGWGRVNLDRATDALAKFTEGAGLATGGGAEYSYNVVAGQPLKVSLAYTDREGSTSAAVSLVNDLDLELVAPDGTVYRGNAFANGWSQTGGSADRRNNLENAYIQNPAAGIWKVRVKGFNVPLGPQNYALVVRAGFSTDPGTQLLVNPGFEAGATGWSGTTGSIGNGKTLPAHSGEFWAALGGNGILSSETLSQQVTIPQTGTPALSLWVRVDTAETTNRSWDRMEVQLLSGDGKLIAVLDRLSNLDKSADYRQRGYDLSAYRGQTVRVHLTVTEDSSLQTTFAVDDTGLFVS